MNIIIAIIIFSAIILFHELGHFSFAKLCHVKVEEFSLGMGPRILSHVSQKSGTRYSVKVLPFGGSCMMKGEDGQDESEDSFASKKVWQRLLIVAAGPLFNFLLAFLFAVIIISSVGYDAPIVSYLTEGYPASEAGIEIGDTITSIGGTRVLIYRDISNYVQFNQKSMALQKDLEITWTHDGEKRGGSIIPQLNSSGTKYIIGIAGGGRFSAEGNVLKILRYSLYEVRFWIYTTIESLKMLFEGEVSVNEVSGPVGIVQVIGETYEETKNEGTFILTLNMLNLAILLSANLGVMNLVPFPALDGGRIVLLLLEAVRRRKLRGNIEQYINIAGFAFLMVIMVLILFNDMRKIL